MKELGEVPKSLSKNAIGLSKNVELLTQNNETAIPEYFSFQRYDLTDKIRIITLKVTLRQELLVPGKNFEIFADTVILEKSTLSLLGKNLMIHARVIVSDGCLIDVSGESAEGFTPGDQASLGSTENQPTPQDANGLEGARGSAGANGKTGGNVTIIAERVDGGLAIKANGGNGGRGQDGGNGTPGGAGRAGDRGLIVKDKEVHKATKGRNGGRGGNGGLGGEAGYGGAAGEIKVILLSPNADTTKILMESRLGERGEAGAQGRAGKGGPGGKGGEMYYNFDLTAGNPQRLPKLDKPDGAKGEDGDSGGGFLAAMLDKLRAVPREKRHTWWDGVLLEQGKLERARNIRELDWEEGNFYPKSNPPVISHQNYEILFTQFQPSLAQKELTFHQAKLIFMARKYAQAGDLLLWLIRTTPESNLKTDLPDAEIEEWCALHIRSAALLGYIHQGLDYFGNPPDFVPLSSIRSYQKSMTSLISIASIIEETYKDYSVQVRKKEQRQNDFEKVKKQISGLIEAQQARELELGNSIKLNNEQLSQLNEQRILFALLLSQSDQEFQNALLRKTQRGCNFGDVLKAGETILAITETAADFALSVRKGSAALKGVRQFQNILENVGNVIKTVKNVKGGLAKLTDVYRSLDTESGEKVPDATKLLMAQKDFDEMLEPFLHLPEAKKYKKRIQDYIGLVQVRNRKLMETDAFRLALSEVKAEINQLKAKSNRLKTNWGTDASNDPTLADYRSLMQGLYEDSRSNLLRMLYNSYQAFSYWSLSYKAFNVADNTIAELSSAYAELIDLMIKETNSLRALPSVFQHTGITLSAEERPEAFEVFRRNGTISFEISATDNESEFFGSANVRVTSWQAEISGASTANKLIKIDLHHSGKAAFINAKGQRIDFSHKKLFGRYAYHTENGGMTEQTDISQDESLIFLSPFTSWTLKVQENLNRDLDLTKVNKIRINFQGKMQPLENIANANKSTKISAKSVNAVLTENNSTSDNNWCGFS